MIEVLQVALNKNAEHRKKNEVMWKYSEAITKHLDSKAF